MWCPEVLGMQTARVESSGPVEKQAEKELVMLLDVKRRPKTGEMVCT
jgi:hypothetical protein